MEGNLSPEQIAQLESFLLQHPELDVDKDVWMEALVDNSEMVYPNQDKLVRRRPVGLYMSMGFASIAILLSLGAYMYFNPDFQKDVQLAKHEMDDRFQLPMKSTQEIKKSISSKERLLEPADIAGDQKQHLSNSTYTASIYEVNQTLGHGQTSKRTISKNKESHRFTSIESSEDLTGLNKVLEVNQPKRDLISLGQIDLERIQTKDPVKIDPLTFSTSTSTSRGTQRYSGNEYKVSFNSRLHKIGRSLQRMLDNPVALKNLRDPYYHVPGMQAMDVNFSAVGTMLATRIQTVSRAQWLGEDNQQVMNQISVDGYSYGMRGGLGFQLNHNYYGKGGIENYNASLTYSPKFSVARNITIEPSLRFKMGNKKLNTAALNVGDLIEYDRMNAQGYSLNGAVPYGKSLWYKDLGLGLMVNTKWFYAGIQGDNLFQHDDNIYSGDINDVTKVGRHFVATLGTDYQSIKEHVTISPYIVYQKQGNLNEAWLGANLRLKWLTVGAAVSSNLEPAASLGLKFEHFAITYNADYTNSQLLNQRSLSHQVTLRFVTKPSRIGQRLLN
jgi:type IX secretion system PorP/SprF family membrane protein